MNNATHSVAWFIYLAKCMFLPIGCEGNIICIDNYSMVMHILKELFSDLRISIVNQPKMAYFKCFSIL